MVGNTPIATLEVTDELSQTGWGLYTPTLIKFSIMNRDKNVSIKIWIHKLARSRFIN